MGTEHEHAYVPFGSAYWKVKDDGITLDQRIDFVNLFCSKCGETKEIVTKDIRNEKIKAQDEAAKQQNP